MALSSDVGDGRVVVFKGFVNSTSISVYPAGNFLNLITEFDSHGAYDSNSGSYYAPSSGYYRLSMIAVGGTVGNPNSYVYAAYQKNSEGPTSLSISYASSTLYASASGSDLVYLSSGDMLRVMVYSSENILQSATAAIEKISSSSTILARNETIACSYTDSSG